jgi:hypothetical protein
MAVVDEQTSAVRSGDVAELAAIFAEAAERALAQGETAAMPSVELERVITAAIKLYAAKAEAEQALPAPVAAERVTPTEIVMVVTEMLRAVNLNLFDLAMWYRRAR